ncbi:MAG: 50S ribosomal protein L25 [Solirubrobacterales bacterium]|nr:50S ribosomal protein L25 [Solirubrobacterales bacterium]
MATTRPSFKVSERTEFGSRTSRRLRRRGLVPGVVYTGGEDARPFQADAHDLSLFINEGHALFDLDIEGAGKVPVVVKEEQRHPVRGDLLHLDCQQVDLKQEIQADVAIELDGVEDAPGVKEGGILEHVTREITIEALPTDIPDEGLHVDVSAMVIGDTIQLDSITPPDGVRFVADAPEEITIATLNPPRVVEEEEPEVEEETELVGEGEGEGAEAAAEESGGEEGDSDSEE